MALRGIDISVWQDDLNLADTWEVEFVIVKLTGGVGYANPSASKHMLQGFGQGKLMGCYHFAQESSCPGSAYDEAMFFVNSFRPYIGKAIPFLDWEADALALDQWWAKEWLDTVRDATGVTPIIYMSKGITHRDWSAVAPEYPLWVAQYPNMEPTGWQDDPWTDEENFGAWEGPTLFQYASTGRIEGYDGNLDLNLFYGERGDWKRMCGGQATEPAPEPTPEPEQPRYMVSTDPSGSSWLDEMVGRYDTGGSGDDFGGELGEPMRWLAIGGVGQYRVCTAANGWLPWVDGYDVNDLENGCAGDGSPILALEIPNGSIRYALHDAGGWNEPMVGNYDTGGSGDSYAGSMSPADAVYIELA